MNPVVGVVGVFNLQGASWDRVRRKFLVHERYPAELATTVAPLDVEPFRAAAEEAAAEVAHLAFASDGGEEAEGEGRRRDGGNGAGGGGGVEEGGGDARRPLLQQRSGGGNGGGGAADAGSAAYACYQYTSRRLRLLPAASSAVAVGLPAAGSDMLWFSPVLRCGDVALAPLGLVDMYNGGGAITSVELKSGGPAAAAAAAARRQPPGGGSEEVARRQEAGGNGAAPALGSGGGPAVVASVGVRGCGRLLLYCSARPGHVWVNMAPRDFTYEPYSGRLEVDVPQSSEGMAAELEVMF
ncbi:hypothetical protein MNEG_12438 [Monoraphidium neglectum]|uniref:Uncharacterized protein n=1 Tax=Monoraphidium neglectum TaxID=145388 RepID=A0A0D2M290_9CHLO|nr:hypothetical protein MNEG_12438 [Monoraphidium neglectum]KIY95526.1 hypothetical protein MNEG_12438 [Monoraphidium neglectum]|eukprot:XP_013894546.1 hypothetical protein MNEG_12438 [Monoraphidium neglectum]